MRSAKIHKIANKVNPAVSYSSITATSTSNLTNSHTVAQNTDTPDNIDNTSSAQSNSSRHHTQPKHLPHPNSPDSISIHQLSTHLQRIQKSVEENAKNIKNLSEILDKFLNYDNE